jgi:hypothetical protein
MTRDEIIGANPIVQFQIRPIEAKLLMLALDPAARGNEITTSAVKLISLLRARSVSAAKFFAPLNQHRRLSILQTRNGRAL